MSEQIIIDQHGVEYKPAWSHHIYLGRLENIRHHCAECRKDYEIGISAENAYLSNHGATDDWKFSATLGAG